MDPQIWRYKGIGSFLDVPLDQQTFFGRSRESRSLLGLVEAEPLVVLFAKSGIGKTSIINAALLKPLRERGYFPIVARLNQDSDDLFRGVLETVSVTARRDGVGHRARRFRASRCLFASSFDNQNSARVAGTT